MATLAIGCGVGVVVARSPVVSVVSLLGSFAALAVVYLLAGYQFLAAIQILVYGGAVMVLFLFTVMLLNLGDVAVISGQAEPLFHKSRRSLVGLAVATLFGVSGLIGVLQVADHELAAMPVNGRDPLNELAILMFTHYSLAFEAASVLLLATAVGVLVLAKRNRPTTHRAFPAVNTAEAPSPQSPDTQPPAAVSGEKPEEVMS